MTAVKLIRPDPAAAQELASDERYIDATAQEDWSGLAAATEHVMGSSGAGRYLPARSQV